MASFREDYHQKYDENNISRRSVDWRDSGIVIDDDQKFNSIDAICDIKSSNSTQSECCLPERIVLDQDDDGDTILHLAVVGCTPEKVKDLIKICDLNVINNMMQTPLHVATMVNRPEMVDVLIKSGARLNVHDRRGNTPLHLACQKGFKDIVILLLDAAKEGLIADKVTVDHHLDVTNFDGQTCLHSAAIHNMSDIIEILVNRYDANLNSRDSRSGATIMHRAIQNLNVGLVEFISSLGKHCNQADFSGRRPLDTLRIISQSKLDKFQQEKFILVEKLVNDRIQLCIEQNGCCRSNKRMINEILDSSSSSDYSDSDSDMS